MAKIIAIANQKGGVAKTTTAVNLAACLASHRIPQRVLLIDLDAQGNATVGCGVDKKTTPNGCDLLMGECDVRAAMHFSESLAGQVIPGNNDLTAAEIALTRQEDGHLTLHRQLQTVHAEFDFILIDCPPSLSMLTINALTAAHGVLIPIQCEYYALEGLSGLMETVEQVRTRINSKLHIEGLLRTMYDPRNRLATDVSAQLLEHFNQVVYETTIPRNVRLAEAPSHGLPIISYDKASRGAAAYQQLAREFMRRNRVRSGT